MIRLERVSLTFDQSKILHDIDLTIPDGEWVALTGRNGSGKSMLMKLIAGIVGPSSGRVSVDGKHPMDRIRDLSGGSSGDRRSGPNSCGGLSHGSLAADGLPVGIAFQNPDSQFVTTSVAREVRFGMENLGQDPSDIYRRFHEAVERFALATFLDRNPHMLSGGEKQRLLLASIWAMNPRHILLDEPFSFLDEASRRSALETVRRTFHDEGCTVVWATLDPEELLLADRVICIEGGSIVYDGSPDVAAIPDGVLTGGITAARDTGAGENHAGRGIDSRMGSPSGSSSDTSRTDRSILELERAVFSPGGGNFTLTIPELSLREGETLGITGSSGSGKTTLLLGCSGLFPPREGILHLFGERVRSRKDFPAGRIAVLFQSPEEGFFAPTVGEEVALGNRRFGAGPADDEAAREALGIVGLDPGIFMKRSPFHLSQGEKRLVALASQLAIPARIFLLDEPTIFLDGSARARLTAALEHLESEGVSLVVASHDTSFVTSLSGRNIELANGRVTG